MFRSLRARLTLGYLVFVMVLFVLVAIVFTREAMQVYARGQNETITETADQIRHIAQTAAPHTFDVIADDVHRLAEKPAVRIVGMEHPAGLKSYRPPFRLPNDNRGVYVKMPPGPPAPSSPSPSAIRRPDNDRDLTDRLLYSLAGLAGIRPATVSVDVGDFFIAPNINRLRSVITLYAISLLALLALCGTLGWLIGNYLARQALAPMVAVTGALQRFAGGDFTPQKIDTRDRSEVGELANAFNGAASQVASAFDERQRVEQHIRQFVADASHELRTPLTVIRGYLDLLKRGALNDPVHRDRAFETLDIESRRMRSLIDKLIVLARLERPEPSQPVRVDLSSVARSSAAEVETISGHPDIALSLEDGAHVFAEEADVHEALANLLDNARKYGEGSAIELRVNRSGPRVVAQVIDGGPGIPDDEKPHIFERFYRGATRGEIDGSGLGLAIAHQAVSRAHGTLRLRESRPGRTVFELELPAAPHHDVPSAPAELVLG